MANFGDVKSDQLQEYFYIPPSVIFPYSGTATSPPTGYLFCNGTAVSRSTYSGLYNTIGTRYGAGNGSTTFNVPDLRGRVIAGRDMTDGSGTAGRLSTITGNGTALGNVGGSQSQTLSNSQLPDHTHSTGYSVTGVTVGIVTNTTGISINSDGDHNHFLSRVYGGGAGPFAALLYTGGYAGSDQNAITTVNGGGHSHGITDPLHSHTANVTDPLHSHTVSTGGVTPTGGATPTHPNIQPTLIIDYIIKV